MLEVQVLMEYSLHMPTGPTSLLLHSWELLEKKRPHLSASQLLQAAEEALIQLVTSTALPLAFILTKETTVCLLLRLAHWYMPLTSTDIVGNNIPVFFIQDAILFPDLIHAVKPQPANEIPQAATAHDTAYDFFGQQPSTLHTLFWAMAGHGIPRSFRHVDGFGVHTYRFVTDDGSSKLVKFHWTSLQGRASLVWEEAQATAGKNADFMRQDLYDSIEAGRYPEWEVCRCPV